MESFIEYREGVYWIANPSDPRENFADAWRAEPGRKTAFFEWLETARIDFKNAAAQGGLAGFVDALAPRMGRRLMESVIAKRMPRNSLPQVLAKSAPPALQRILDAPHRKPVAWPLAVSGTVRITSALVERKGFRPQPFASDDTPLSRGVGLRFQAETNVQAPYKTYWQVVNTGAAARTARGLRGGFEERAIEPGGLTKIEFTLYPGSHSIECFVVKDGRCVARSGPFIVNIS